MAWMFGLQPSPPVMPVAGRSGTVAGEIDPRRTEEPVRET
jgi:hypothetical protein